MIGLGRLVAGVLRYGAAFTLELARSAFRETRRQFRIGRLLHHPAYITLDRELDRDFEPLAPYYFS